MNAMLIFYVIVLMNIRWYSEQKVKMSLCRTVIILLVVFVCAHEHTISDRFAINYIGQRHSVIKPFDAFASRQAIRILNRNIFLNKLIKTTVFFCTQN